MKRRVISFMTALVLCLGLCPGQVLAAGWEPDDFDFADMPDVGTTVNQDTTIKRSFEISWDETFDTCGHSYSSPDTTVLIIKDGGKVYLTYGTIESGNGTGIEIQGGGFLCVKDPGMNVIGTEYSLDIQSGAEARIAGGTFEGGMYGLRIESGAEVRISGGTFTGEDAAIWMENDSYGDLLVTGYAFFDEDDKVLRPEEMSGAEKVLQVKKCARHEYVSYTANPGKPTHNGTCVYCGETADLECKFSFDGNNWAECEDCKRRLTITIDEDKLVYNGIDKPSADAVKVELDNSTRLTEGTDYTVDFSSRVEGEITVTVTSTSKSNTWTYTKSFSDTRAVLTISWADGSDRDADYTGSIVARSELPEVIISGAVDTDKAELEQLIYFSYKKDGDDGDADFSDGLPTDAGEYQIKANLPATQNYRSASSDSINLKINKINPIVDRPEAVTVTYDRYAHELVTPGSVWSGAVIQFARTQGGPWSESIPTETNAGEYEIWYKVDGTNNYENVLVGPITAQIQKRWIEPSVSLNQTSFVYDNAPKEPSVTIKDPSDGNWDLHTSEYKVEYANNQNVGTATATVSPSDNSNYDFDSVICHFTISKASQDGLSITGQPNQVFYGDVFTLSTTGGSGSGTVTWEIIDAKNAAGRALGSSDDFSDVAEIDEDSGQITVNGLGSFTVQAKKFGTESDAEGNETTNREDTTAEVTFHVDPRPVTATVTAASKPYDGTNTATVSAKVEQGVVFGDTITITGLIGEFSDENAGTGKTVTVSIEGADFKIEVPVETIGDDPDEKNYEKYVVTIPTTPVTADITPKPVENPDVTLDCDSYTYDGTEKKPAVTVKDGNDEIPPKEYTVTYSNNINVGTKTAKAIVTDNPGGNYTIETVEVPFSITTGGQAVLTSSPQARDLTYNRKMQDLVTVGTATGGSLVYALKTGDTEPTDYYSEIPQGDSAGEYIVCYKVEGDDNHGDSAVYFVYVTIKPKTVTSPVIELAASRTFTYDGTPKTFTFNDPDEPNEITVKDGDDEIPATEYDVTYSNNVNAGTATVHIVDKNGGNYNVSGSKPFQIEKATAKFDPEPTGKPDLTYNGEAQELIIPGLPKGGTAYYWLDGGAYSTSLPTGTNQGTYKVHAQVRGDANYDDSAEIDVIEVTISKNTVDSPTIELSASSFQYNGSEQKPTVTVKDDKGYVIPVNEYTVTYEKVTDTSSNPESETTVEVEPGDIVDAGKYYVVIKSKNEDNCNYSFTTKKRSFTITEADQTPLAIIGKPSVVYYGDTLYLGTTGGSGNGAVTWSVEPTNGATNDNSGQFKITGVGNIKIKATRTSANYTNTEDTWEFYAYPKPVNAVVRVKSRDYDETTNAEIESITVPEVEGITITIKEDYKTIGRFADKDVGTNKLVTFTITADMLDVINGENYQINYPTTAVASITPAAVTVNETNEPTANKGSDGNNLVYNGQEQPLLTLPAGAVLDGGSWAYSTDGASYGPSIPKGENAGEYKVWYKVIPDSNHKFDTVLDPVTVTIEKKEVTVTVTCSPETFPYDGTEKKPNVIVTYQDDDGSTQMISDQEYTVEFPEERTEANAEDENYTVTVTANADGNYEFTNSSAEGTFKILPIDQAPLTIVTEKPGFVYYDDTFKLSAVGGSGTGEIIWEIVDEKDKDGGTVSQREAIAEITPDGVVTVNGVGSFTVTAYREKTEGSYKESDRDSITFTVRPKPVTAVVTAQDKEYDGSAAADLTVTVPDAVGITVEVDSTYKGTFDNANVGTGKIVTFKTISENVTVDGKEGNYDITYPTETTATIRPADVKVKEADGTVKNITGADHPQAMNPNPVYNGSLQPLITLGADLDGGFWAYSTNGVDYNRLIPETIPTGKNAGTYRIWYKVIPDSNHKFDTVLDPVTVTIEKKAVAVTVTCSPATFPYDGNPKTPTVTVKDADDNVISADEYTVEYPQDSYSMGEHKVKITSKGNYEFTNDPEGTFEITSAAQSRLTIVYNQDRTVYFGDNFWVSASGGFGTGGIEWGIESGADDTGTIAVITPDSEMSERAKVSVEGVGSFTVTAYRKADSSYSQSEPATMPFTALPKPVTATVTAEDKTYDGNDKAELVVTWEPALVDGYEISTTGLTGTFKDGKDVGKNKEVEITGDITDTRYDVTLQNRTTTATISIAKAEINGEPTAASGTIYAGDNVPLIVVSGVTTNFGEIVYALENPYEEQDDMLDEDLDDYEDLDPDPPGLMYTADIPTAKEITKAGTYKVWYKIKPTDNWAGTEPKPVSVTVKDKEAGTSGGTSPGSTPSQAPSTSQTSRPSTDNSSDTSSGTNTSQTTTKPGTGSVSMQTSVQDKTASTVLDSAAGSQLVNEAVANKSTNVVIKPEITGDVSKTEVSIPASAVSRIASETDAALTVSTPVADVTIPNASLDTFSGAGSTVSVVTERVENTVVLTLNADGKDIGDIPGGLTLTVPSENATPGTVAVLIHEDGTREIIRKSVAEDGGVRIPLNGSATVEIVDNSKQFADVPAESWAADAVAFASAHEILNGTGEAMFSPEVSMSRAMLATVLYNLEGCPDQELTGAFSDVSNDAWYAAGVSWAAANGITSGYGDGQYGPNDNITREQLAVMLWRYMESPAADKQVPDFTDTDQASSYAMEALYWAAANGIVNGYGNGQLDPSGPATRAQAAQMLKNFIENT